MKTFIVAVIFFIIWFVFWWGFWINIWLNFGYESLISWFKNGINSGLSTTKDTLSGSYSKAQKLIDQKKQEYVKELKIQKDKIIENVQNDIKNKLKEEIDNLF